MTKSRSPLVIIFITIFIDLVGFGIVIPVLPLYAERYGASETTIGVLVATYSAMQFIFAPLLGKVSDRVGRRPVLLVSLIGTSVGFLIMGLAPQMPVGFALLGLAPTLVWLFVARIIDGISGGNISTAQAYIADATPPEERSKDGLDWRGVRTRLRFRTVDRRRTESHLAGRPVFLRGGDGGG